MIKTEVFRVKEKEDKLNYEENTIVFGDVNHSYLGQIWEGQVHNEKGDIYLFSKVDNNIYRVFIHNSSKMVSGEVRKYIGKGIYELIAFISLNGEKLQNNFYLTSQEFKNLWYLMFPETFPKKEYDQDEQRETFLAIFKECEIPLEYIDKFIENEIEVNQLQDLKPSHLEFLIDKLGHRLKLEKYIEKFRSK